MLHSRFAPSCSLRWRRSAGLAGDLSGDTGANRDDDCSKASLNLRVLALPAAVVMHFRLGTGFFSGDPAIRQTRGR